MSLSTTTTTLQEFIKSHPTLSTLTQQDLETIYQDLIDCILGHNELYYQDAQPIISDSEWDELFVYLKKIEANYPTIISTLSPTQNLDMQSGTVSEGFEKAEHVIPLLSLDNSYNTQDIQDFDERIHKELAKQIDNYDVTYSLEPKFDGISVELIYKNGVFVQAITRGDGYMGEDITANVRTIANIPDRIASDQYTFLLDGRLSLRGEILMPQSQLISLNKQREKEGLQAFANTRNAAAGSVKLLDSALVKTRGLVCYVYDVLDVQSKFSIDEEFEKNISSYDTLQKILSDLGLPFLPDRPHQKININDVIAICADPTSKQLLDTHDIDFDGLVIKVNGKKYRDLLGTTNHHPRRAIAYKFPAEQKATQIVDIQYQVGRTGIITPVALLEPVQLSGVIVSRVSLHNLDFIKQKGILNNDRVFVQRSGEVIPYIVATIPARRDNTQTQIIPPHQCPSCEQPLVSKDNFLYCYNSTCKAKLGEQCKHFVSKNCMDIDGLGESIIDILIEQNIITKLTDIYRMLLPDVQFSLSRTPGFGDKKIRNIVSGLESSKHAELRRILNALGMPGVGKKIAKVLQQHIAEQTHQDTSQEQKTLLTYKQIRAYLSDKDFLEDIYGIGTKIITDLVEFCETNKEVFEELDAWGVERYNLGTHKVIGSSLAGKTFVITGTFPYKREHIVAILEQEGAKEQNTVSKKTDFVLIGENAGSKKDKAEKLKIPLYVGRDAIVQYLAILQTIETANKESLTETQGLFS